MYRVCLSTWFLLNESRDPCWCWHGHPEEGHPAVPSHCISTCLTARGSFPLSLFQRFIFFMMFFAPAFSLPAEILCEEVEKFHIHIRARPYLHSLHETLQKLWHTFPRGLPESDEESVGSEALNVVQGPTKAAQSCSHIPHILQSVQKCHIRSLHSSSAAAKTI